MVIVCRAGHEATVGEDGRAADCACIISLRAEVTRLKAALATARDSLQHQSEAAAQGWERAATYLDATPLQERIEELERLLDLAHGALAERDEAMRLADVCLDALNAEKVAHLATMRRVGRLTAWVDHLRQCMEPDSGWCDKCREIETALETP